MEISVDGIRASVADWRAVQSLPAAELPKLTEAQRQVARKLNISEEDYARSALAGQRTTESLLAKTETLARFLDQRVKAIDGATSIERVALRTYEHRFDVELNRNGQRFHLRVEENLVDDLLEGGSSEARERLSSAVKNVLAIRSTH